MIRQTKIYRNPIFCTLVVVLFAAFPAKVYSQIKEQLYHDNVVPEHLVSSLSPDVFLSAYTFHRSQWTGLSNKPSTTGLGVNYRLNSSLVVQLYYVYDVIQSVENQDIKLGVNYSLGKEKRINFGLRFGVNLIGQSQNYTAVDPIAADPLLSNALSNETSFDADFSVGYKYNDFRVGVGINNLLESGFAQFGVNSSRTIAVLAQNNFTVNIFGAKKVMASVLYKSELQSVMSGVVDVKSILFVTPKLGLGGGYRFKESIPLLLQYKGLVSNYPFVVQYSYDIQMGALSNYNTGSHEISLRINLKNRPLIETELDFDERERKSKNVRFL